MRSWNRSIGAGILLCLACASGRTIADEGFDACLKTAGPQNTHCGEQWLAREQVRLDAGWRLLMEVADGDIAAALAAEQRAWEGFRDLSCIFKLDEGFGGASGPNGFHPCRAEVVADRAAAIEAYTRYIDN